MTAEGTYAVQRRGGDFREFSSRSAARKFNRELPPLALQYRKGVWVYRSGRWELDTR